MTTQIRVDENRLRKQQVDTLPQLIAEIAEYRQAEREGKLAEWHAKTAQQKAAEKGVVQPRQLQTR